MIRSVKGDILRLCHDHIHRKASACKMEIFHEKLPYFTYFEFKNVTFALNKGRKDQTHAFKL